MKGDRVPTYQYACTECGEQLEMVQRFSDDPLSVCPACSGRLRKVFSPVGIVFKGSGFYRTDSRAGNGAKDGKDGRDGKTTEAASSGANSGGSGDKSDKGEKKAAATTSSSKESSSGAPSPASSSGSTSEKVA
jgi:putative FmdB family regulatory protein